MVFISNDAPKVALSSQAAFDLARPRVAKRIIVCCDGTWQNGVASKLRWQNTNILKLSRILNPQDDRRQPPILQIVFYQAGIGSAKNFYSEYVEAVTGASLGAKVQDAYAFIEENYQAGDEIFLFGFSRGAYTVRMCAALIGEIGLLDKEDMDHFADIFIAYQKQAKEQDPKQLAKYKAIIEPFNNPSAKGKLRTGDNNSFSIKVVGVFDTVGSMGLPEELTFGREVSSLFGFNDKLLGTHIEHAFHAIALNETRVDFNVTKFEQTQAGRAKGQVLKQVWFTGEHSDIGGGWKLHDLSDISLAWMVSNIEQMLSVDREYLYRLLDPVAPWGAQMPHDPQTGVFRFTYTTPRTLPTKTDNLTCETVHPSVMSQEYLMPELEANLKQHPALLASLAPLEEQVKSRWPYIPGKDVQYDKVLQSELQSIEREKQKLLDMNQRNAEL